MSRGFYTFRPVIIMAALLLITASSAAGCNNAPANHTSGDTAGTVPEKADELELLRQKANSGELRVLFIGDSLTYYNNMPDIFERLASSAGKKIFVGSLTKGGTGLAMMRDDAAVWQEVTDKINSDKWDVVVFQPNRNHPVMPEYFPQYPFEELKAARDMAKLIENAGALPLDYSTFGVNTGRVTREGHTKIMTREAHTDLITAYNAAVSGDIGCPAVYTGATFNKCISEYPEINLYHTDSLHPSLAGSYLIACDFYTVIYGESPAGISYAAGLDETTREKLQNTAESLLAFTPSEIAAIIENEEPEKTENQKDYLIFGAHGYSGIPASGHSNFLEITDDCLYFDCIKNPGIVYGFASLEGKPFAGDSYSFELDTEFLEYGGSSNPSAGFQLITSDGNTIRLYARTNGSNITGKDGSTASYQIRVDMGGADTAKNLGTYTNKLHMKLDVTPGKIMLYVDGALFVTITSAGAEFYDGTTSPQITYTSASVQLGLVMCYSNISFTNLEWKI